MGRNEDEDGEQTLRAAVIEPAARRGRSFSLPTRERIAMAPTDREDLEDDGDVDELGFASTGEGCFAFGTVRYQA